MRARRCIQQLGILVSLKVHSTGAHMQDPFSCHQMSKIVRATLRENFVGAVDGNRSTGFTIFQHMSETYGIFGCKQSKKV